MDVGSGVNVGSGVHVGTGVKVGAGVNVGTGVKVAVGIGVMVDVGVNVGTDVCVGTSVDVIVGSGITVGVNVGASRSAICPPSVGSLFSSSDTDTAKPMLVTGLPASVCSILDELTPITSPSLLTSGPPLLPGFRDASVCSS